MENQRQPFWTRDSSILLGGFFVTIFLIVYIWWPLAEEVLSYIDWNGPWWRYMDWLLLGVFLFMSITIIARANLKTDVLIVFVGICGGLTIESWGTQTNLWHYYTAERPPLWIIPALRSPLWLDTCPNRGDCFVAHLPSRRTSGRCGGRCQGKALLAMAAG